MYSVDELTKLSECPVCLESKQDNRTLTPCGHSMCKECLEIYLSKKNDVCPECKAKFKIFQKPTDFMRDFRKNALVDLLLKAQSRPTTEISPQPTKKGVELCHECAVKVATLRCEVCQLSFCVDDDAAIHKPKVFQTHKRVPILLDLEALQKFEEQVQTQLATQLNVKPEKQESQNTQAVMKEVRRMLGKEDEIDDPSLYVFKTVLNDFASKDDAKLTSALTHFRSLLASENAPLENVIKAGLIQKLITVLNSEHTLNQQALAFETLRLVCKGPKENSEAVARHGAIPIALSFMASTNGDVSEHTFWILGNIAASSAENRNKILSYNNLFKTMEQQIDKQQKKETGAKRSVAWFVCQLCGGRPRPSHEVVSPVASVIAKIIPSKSDEILSDICWALAYFSEAEKGSALIVATKVILARIVQLISHSTFNIQYPAVITLKNLVQGPQKQILTVVEAGVMPSVNTLLRSLKVDIKVEALLILGKIAAVYVIPPLLASNIFPNVLDNIDKENQKIKEIAVHTLFLLLEHKNIDNLLSLKFDCLKILCNCFPALSTAESIKFALKDILAIFAKLQPKALSEKMQDCDGWNKVGNLLIHADQEVVSSAKAILKYCDVPLKPPVQAAPKVVAPSPVIPPFSFGSSAVNPAPVLAPVPSFSFVLPKEENLNNKPVEPKKETPEDFGLKLKQTMNKKESIEWLFDAKEIPKLLLLLQTNKDLPLEVFAIEVLCSSLKHNISCVSLAVPVYISVLKRTEAEVQVSTLKALATICSLDGVKSRDMVLTSGVFGIIKTKLLGDVSVSYLNQVTSLIKDICSIHPKPEFDHMFACLEVLGVAFFKVSTKTMEEATCNICDAVAAYCSEPLSDKEVHIMKAGKIIELLLKFSKAKSQLIQQSTLQALANFGKHGVSQSEALMELGTAKHISSMLMKGTAKKPETVVALWKLVAVLCDFSLQVLMDLNIFSYIDSYLISTCDTRIKGACILVLISAANKSSAQQLKELSVFLAAVCKSLKSLTNDTESLGIALDYLLLLLSKKGVKIDFEQLMQDCNGFSIVEALQNHLNADIVQKVKAILNKQK